MIKDENYVSIQGWMINSLKLKGNELIIYALIYGFTQDGEQWFEGSRQYLAEWCNSTKRGVQKNLKTLVEKGYLIKEDVVINNVKFCKYKSNLDVIHSSKQSYPTMEQSSPTQGTKFTGGSEQSYPPPREQSSPNNININNIDNNIDNKKVSKKEKAPEKKSLSFDEIIDSYTDNEELRMELKEHLKTRKSKKATMTNRAIELSLNKLDKISSSDDEKIQIVQNAIMSGWTTFYPLKNNDNKPTNSYQEQRVTINGKEYIMKNGKYYVPRGSGIPVNPYAVDDLPF